MRYQMNDIYNRMDPDHYDEEYQSIDELADLQAEIEEENRKETVIGREIRSIEEVF